MGNNFRILFDLNGTLVDNEHLKARAFSEAIEQLGGESPPSVYKGVMGMSGLKIRRHFAERANIHMDLDEYAKLYKSIYQDLIKTESIIKPGVIPFIAELKSKKIKLAIVSGAYRDSVLYIINALTLGHYFDFVMIGDDVAKKKLDPESYIVALGKMALLREQVIVFEDTESGLKAVNSAGLTSMGIRCI